MMKASSALFFCIFFALSLTNEAYADLEYVDVLLHKIIKAYQLEPYQPKAIHFGPKERLGRTLFFDSILSGPQGVACASCHIRNLGSGDGLALAIGIGATGVSKERESQHDAFVIPRNTLPLFNRGSKEIDAFFWDGRVQLGPNGSYESPLGKSLPSGFDNLLAVASVFPIVEPDEMLGHSRRKVGLSKQHRELVTVDGLDNNYQARTLNVFENITKRITSDVVNSSVENNIGYKTLFGDAYPEMPFEDITITHIGNALSAYINIAFMLNESSWDRYIRGDKTALSGMQKRGAILFYGKGRCAACHRGQHFSDFRFHGLAVPQFRVGKHSRYQDYGRAIATDKPEQRYTFRTPSLRNVYETGPWAHNGSFTSIKKIIQHHINPILTLYQAETADPEQGRYTGRILSSRSDILAEIGLLSDREIEELLSFLTSLSSSYILSDDLAIPSASASDNSLIEK
ncbi:MAG: His-Xaa-Ser system-associated MauG-like protein [Candidatus Thiodiazotropha taylori]|nr:His-Xaa-Ser system-associated MauG-like protein [Candidatus Thiodiazotropha taylori]MCW4316754.1 His-Xaa-Ser system-associated MauG-like protein [Candidatus Thiodiazotropha taylori]